MTLTNPPANAIGPLQTPLQTILQTTMQTIQTTRQTPYTQTPHTPQGVCAASRALFTTHTDTAALALRSRPCAPDRT
jgi:hypothetical protein